MSATASTITLQPASISALPRLSAPRFAAHLAVTALVSLLLLVAVVGATHLVGGVLQPTIEHGVNHFAQPIVVQTR